MQEREWNVRHINLGITAFVTAFVLGAPAFGQQAALSSSMKKSPVVKEQSPWSASLSAQAYSHQLEQKSFHWTEFDVAYELNSILALTAWGAFTGPLHASQSGRAVFEDPEIGLSAEIPMSGDSKRWTLLAGVGGTAPVTEASRDLGLIAGVRLTGGLRWSAYGWKAEMNSSAYHYAYRQKEASDSAEEGSDVVDANGVDDDRSGPVSGGLKAIAPDERTFLATTHILRVGTTFAKRIAWGCRTRYRTYASGDGEFADDISVSTKIGYKWMPKFETYLGLGTNADLSNGDSPQLFSAGSYGGFVGLSMSI